MSRSSADPGRPEADGADPDLPEASVAGQVPGPRVPRDLVAGLVMLGLVWLFLGKAGEVSKGNYDWLFPVVLSYALGILAIALVVRGLRDLPNRGHGMPLVPTALYGRGTDVVLFAMLMVVYTVLASRIGFWISSVAMIAIAAIFLDTAKSIRRHGLTGLVAVAVCVVGYLVLTGIFYIKYPIGSWGW